MLLPNAEVAIISESKTRDYLFNPDHRNNGGKWRLFAGLGYVQDNWQQFVHDVRDQHLGLDAVELPPNDFSRRFKIEGELRGPLGSAIIRTTWAVPFATGIPHLTSAYRVKQR